MMQRLTFALATPYTLNLGYDLLTQPFFYSFCKDLAKRIALVADDQVMPLYGHDLQRRLESHGVDLMGFTFPAGERYKTRDTKQHLEDCLMQQGFGRDTCLLALGGGVTCDLVGFLAATYCRGIPVIYLPTTLLAMVDACMGGKTGVNTPYGKNLIGTFTQPYAIFADTKLLITLNETEWRNGWVEVIKHSLIADSELFDYLITHHAILKARDACSVRPITELIYRNACLKKAIVEQDTYDHSKRQLLNFGHTIGHAIEYLEQYRISHGEAVAMGMLVEGYLSHLQGLLAFEWISQLHILLRKLGLPLSTDVFHDKVAFKKALAMDKKAMQQTPRFVLLKAPGEPHITAGDYVVSLAQDRLDHALDWAHAHFSKDRSRCSSPVFK